MLLAGIVFSCQVSADLELTPAVIDLKSYSESVKVLVSSNGKPVLSADIKKIVAGVFKTGRAVPVHARDGTHFSDYSYMFSFKANDDGYISITPVESHLQIGDYDLYVYTTHGTVTGVIDANLRDSIPVRPPTKIKSPTFSYNFELPDYLYGQDVSITLPADDKHTYTWYLDGEIHSSGLGLTTLKARPAPGDHEIMFIARKPDGEVVSSWTGTTRVSAEEPIRKTYRKGDKITFAAPDGYTQVSWIFDGKLVSESQLERSEKASQLIAFKKRGAHTLVCQLENSENGHSRRITWSVNVK